MIRGSGLFGELICICIIKQQLSSLCDRLANHYFFRVVTVLMGISSLVFYTLAARAPLVKSAPDPDHLSILS